MRIVRILTVVFIVPVSTLLSTSAFSQFPHIGGSRPDSFLIPPGSFESCSLTQSARERVNSCSAYINNRRYFESDNEARRIHAYVLLGDSYNDVGELDKALATFSDAVRRFPGSALAYNGRGWAQYRLKNYDAALADANKSIELNPRQAVAYGTRGAIHEAIGNTELAIKDYQTGVRNQNDYQFGIRALRRLGATFPSGVTDPEAVKNTPPAPDPGIVFARQRYMSPRQRRNNDDMGGYIEDVMPGSMAARAGIRSGDFIISAGGRRVLTAFELRQVLDAARNAARRSIQVVVAGPGGQRQVTLSW